MAGPLTLKSSSAPATAANLEGLRELTSSELRDYVSYAITSQFAGGTIASALLTVTTGTLGSDFTNIGTFSNRERNETVGTHPAGGAITTTTNTFGQNATVPAGAAINRPIRWDGNDTIESTDAQINTEVLDEAIAAMVTEDANAVGQYKIGTSSPSGGTWTARFTITETQVDGTDVAYKLWQKTGVTTTPATNTNSLIKAAANGQFTEMTSAEMKLLTQRFANRILNTGIGTYRLTAGTPTDTGSWTQVGSTMTDQLKSITNVSYTGAYTGAYTGNYTGSYTGYYNRFFAGYLNGAYAGSYSGTYTGYYTGYYSGAYVGATVQTSSSTQETKALFIRTA
jgi:hypothetical protein